MNYIPVIIEGFKVTKNCNGFQIAVKPITWKKYIVATSRISPEDVFKKFVAKCDKAGVNYKTDFLPKVTPSVAPKGSKKQLTTTVNIVNEITINKEVLEKLTQQNILAFNELLDANKKIMETILNKTPKSHNIVNPCKTNVSGRTVREIEVEYSKLTHELAANHCNVKFKELVKLQSELSEAMFN